MLKNSTKRQKNIAFGYMHKYPPPTFEEIA